MLGALALLAAAALGGCAAENAGVPDMELRSQALNKTIMCPVCPGESIDQSQNTLAVQMRGVVEQKLADGWSDEQIRSFFVERYGPAVLLEPPREGIGLAAWLAAPIAVVVAAAGWLFALRKMRRRTAASEDASLPDGDTNAWDDAPDAELRAYYTRIQTALDADAVREDER